MVNFCNFPNIMGLVSLCTGELLSLASNMYLIILTVVVVLFSRGQKCRTNRWSLHRMSWVLISINCVFALLSGTAWFILVKTESVAISQALNILSIICLPLTFHLLEQNYNTRFVLTITFYCLMNAISKMLVVASFSREGWDALSGLDVRLMCASVQSICLLLLIFLTIYNFWCNFKKDFEEIPNQDQSPQHTFLSKVLYGWCVELLVKGKRQTLHVVDCIAILPQPDLNTFEDIEPQNIGITPLYLLILLIKSKLCGMIMAGLLLLVVVALEFVPLYVSYGVIRDLQSNYTQNQVVFTLHDFPNNNYSLLSLYFICECTRCVLYQYHISMTSGFAAHTHFHLQSLLYDKVKRIAQWELKSDDNLCNLMTVDIARITTGLQVLHQLWRIPVQCTVCILILETLVSFSCLVPIVLLLGFVMLITILLHHRSKQETILQANKQHWYYMIKEFIEHIWILKIDNWQNFFKSKILKKHEETKERKVMMLFSAVQILKHIIPVVMVTSMFGIFDIIQRGGAHTFTPQAAVITVLLLSMLRNLLTLAQTISKNTLDMVHSLDDVVVFLNRDEIEPAKVEEENHYMADECAIAASISNGTFTWGTERMSPKVLSNINIQIPKGHLTLIIGKPAAGKSSLLSALLSEMNCIVGEVCWSGDKDIAYAAQYPAIFGGTVQDNVLFGMDYDAERYLKIITLCNLVDHTININESKTNSLHQISLARALYSSANTVILDDPLAGLNPESRDQFFFESVVLFAGEEKRTVVMTTTDPELLEHAYQVILLDEGRIVYQGKPDNDTLREHPIIAELTTANVRSLPPPVPHRRRFDNKSVETNEVHVKNVPSTAYKEWIQSSSGLNLAFALISLSCMVFLNATMYWLLLGWITHSSTVARVTTVTMSPNVVTKAPRHGYNFSAAVSDKGSPFPFLCAGGGVVVLQLLTVLLVNSVVHSASNTLLKDMLHSVCSVCLYAYNKTPVSAVLNRFTVDLELIGRPLMECLGAVLFLTSETLATIIVQVIVSPGSLVVLVPLTVCLVWMFLLYSPTSRVLRILQTEFKQNIYKHISETVSCLTLVRGYNVTDRYRTRLQTHSTKLYHINMVISGTSRWLSLYQDLTVNLITFGCFVATCLVSEQGRTEMSALSFLLILLSTQQLRLIWNYLESCDIILSSIDNCTNYAYHIPRETETPRFKPPKDWPQFGAISIKDVFASLSPDQEPILRNINLEIPAGTKLGVSSVQGGGKEFIVPLLFRSLYINNGNVKIDEWDTSSLSLEDLRAHISFISSDPPIYTGSIRYNIDPEVKQEDHEIWKVLEKVYLQEKIADLPKNLDSDDFAMNRQERQLLNLAKVLLNPSSIIVVEESKFITNVDLFTKFYEVLDRELGTRTRIIIGRRSVTLETCDKLLFLDQGRLVSFGDKDDLERDNCSYYRQLNRASARVSRLPSES